MGWINEANVQVDRKMLADLAVHDFLGFQKIVEAVRPSA
jgi:ribosomal protein L20